MHHESSENRKQLKKIQVFVCLFVCFKLHALQLSINHWIWGRSSGMRFLTSEILGQKCVMILYANLEYLK